MEGIVVEWLFLKLVMHELDLQVHIFRINDIIELLK